MYIFSFFSAGSFRICRNLHSHYAQFKSIKNHRNPEWICSFNFAFRKTLGLRFRFCQIQFTQHFYSHRNFFMCSTIKIIYKNYVSTHDNKKTISYKILLQCTIFLFVNFLGPSNRVENSLISSTNDCKFLLFSVCNFTMTYFFVENFFWYKKSSFFTVFLTSRYFRVYFCV